MSATRHVACPECRKAMRQAATIENDVLLVCEGCLCGHVIPAGTSLANAPVVMYQQSQRFHGKVDERNAQLALGTSRDYARTPRGEAQVAYRR